MGSVVESPTTIDFESANVVQVAIVPSHGVALTDQGVVWSWGEDTRNMSGGSTVPAPAIALSGHVVNYVVASNSTTFCFCNGEPCCVFTMEMTDTDTLAFFGIDGNKL